MTDISTDKELEFPINQELLEDATHAKEEWRVVKGRLTKIQEQRDQVSEAVFIRVSADYEARLKEATDAVMRKKTEIDQELSMLYATKEKLSEQLGGHREKLEEIKFRNTLGEFSEEEYQGAARVEQDKISKLETILGAVDGNIKRYESIFEGEDELLKPTGRAASAPPRPAARPAAKSQTKKPADEGETDEFNVGGEDEGPNYFSAETDVNTTNPDIIEESETHKQPPSMDAPKTGAGQKIRGRIVIISGDDAGAAYPLKGTVSFGRAESNTVVLRDVKVSRQHAQIEQQGDEFVLIDLSSSNGTYVNSQRIEEYVLANGDEIQIGDTIMQFQN